VNPLVLLLAAGAVLALTRRKPSGFKCMWTDEYRGLCYSTRHELLVTSRFGFYVKEDDAEGHLFQSGLDYPSESSAAQAARAWIDYHLDR